ncbi:MAG: tRNA dihydrouridine(20/20a) synthase DusA, partial [Bacillota bacterium]|nr:tRNA dihydrouridine(20/20a) synthase DusA [Bacillota bacterium]
MDEYLSQTPSPMVSIAPMVDKTDRHFRYFSRILTSKALLYTEMITCQAILHGDRNKLLDFSPEEKPVALQIAGSSPEEVYEAVRLAEDWDYDEINLNVGCPSDRVSGNCMGAALMAYPELVHDMLEAMRKATTKPVTVKHRIGIEGRNVLPETFTRTLFDRYEDMVNFVTTIKKAQVDRFIIHARIAILEGLSPKENREIPPLRYDEVYR